MQKLKILFISAEVDPYAKAGGLGDVAGSLPKALADLGHDVRVVMPAYSNIERGFPGVQPLPHQLKVPIRGGSEPAGLFGGLLPGSKVPVYFIGEWHLFNRDRIYGYEDDAYRFAFFSRAAFELLHAIGWYPDILHAHDWHTAPAVLWQKTGGQVDDRLRNIKSVFTIHNLAHQGRTSWDIIDYLNIYTHSLAEEDFGRINLMARGIYHSDIVTTVSPTYAREITTPAGGAQLDGLLRHRGDRLVGILNGIDDQVWNPATDNRLPYQFDASDLAPRHKVRQALQDAVGLPRRDNIPVVALISRLDWQKGLDLLGEVIHRLMNNWAGEAQFILLGSGNPQYEDMLRGFDHYHHSKMRAVLNYNAGLAPLIYGGCDIFLMPSLFEPCGLSQLLSMRYGAIPVVRATGGLVDTVIDNETGFVFHDFNVDAFWEGVARAIYVHNTNRAHWDWIQQNGLNSDWSWTQSAQKYAALYRQIA